ncbi:MAG: hypothetical protein AAGN15_16955 [Cyanobacteria bacterium J06581_3]
MKRFIFSAFSIMLAAGAMATEATALPQVDDDFKVHTLRLEEFDTRNKSEFKVHTLRLEEFDARNKSEFKVHTLRLEEFDARNKSEFKVHTLRLSEFDARNKGEASEETYYPYGQAPAQASEWTEPQDATADNTVNSETPWPAAAEAIEEEVDRSPSVAERRQEVLDRS